MLQRRGVSVDESQVCSISWRFYLAADADQVLLTHASRLFIKRRARCSCGPNAERCCPTQRLCDLMQRLASSVHAAAQGKGSKHEALLLPVLFMCKTPVVLAVNSPIHGYLAPRAHDTLAQEEASCMQQIQANWVPQICLLKSLKSRHTVCRCFLE